MTANTTSDTDRGAAGQGAGMTRRSILRGLIPAVAVAAGAASLLGGGEVSATGANVPGGGAGGRRGRRDRQDRQDRQDRDRRDDRDQSAGGTPADRRRRPRRDRNPNPGPAPRPRPQPPAPMVQTLLAQYSYDTSGVLTVSGSGFIPNVLVSVALIDTNFPFLFSTTVDTVPGPDGAFSFTLTGVCPPSLIVTATQSGLAPVTRAVDFGVYTCLVV